MKYDARLGLSHRISKQKNTHIRKNVCQVYKGEIEEKLLTGCSNQLMKCIMPNRAAAVKYFLHFISSQCVFNHLFCSLISKIQINRLLGVKIIFYIKPKSDSALQIIFQQTRLFLHVWPV